MTIYLIDTNILMSLESYDSLLARCEGKITIPMYVLEELDNLKNKEGDKGFKARRALRNIEKYADDIDVLSCAHLILRASTRQWWRQNPHP